MTELQGTGIERITGVSSSPLYVVGQRGSVQFCNTPVAYAGHDGSWPIAHLQHTMLIKMYVQTLEQSPVNRAALSHVLLSSALSVLCW